nr:MAG TPA: hypothetical protein [Bacteriophage sp.]
MNICYIKKTGQSVLGKLQYEEVMLGTGWRLDDKGKKYWDHGKFAYIPIFKCGHPVKRFIGYSEIIVDDKIEFTAYCSGDYRGIDRLIGKDTIDDCQLMKIKY